MSATLTINLDKPIKSAAISAGDGISPHSPSVRGSGGNGLDSRSHGPELDAQKGSFPEVKEALQNAVERVNKFCEGAFVEHKEQIAKLAVEIARKILVKKVEEGDYKIELIVKEAIKNAPARQDVVVHLNPDDLAQYRQFQETGAGEVPAGVKFIPDANVGRAECVVETPKGIVESLIDRHLEQVCNALNKVQ